MVLAWGIDSVDVNGDFRAGSTCPAAASSIGLGRRSCLSGGRRLIGVQQGGVQTCSPAGNPRLRGEDRVPESCGTRSSRCDRRRGAIADDGIRFYSDLAVAVRVGVHHRRRLRGLWFRLAASRRADPRRASEDARSLAERCAECGRVDIGSRHAQQRTGVGRSDRRRFGDVR